MKTNGQMSMADFSEALKENRLMFVTKFFADLGINNPDDVANRFNEEEHRTFLEFLEQPYQPKEVGHGPGNP